MPDHPAKSRLEIKDDLMMKLGALYAPLENFVLHGCQNEEEKVEICGRFRGELDSLLHEARSFCNPKKYVFYDSQHQKFADAYNLTVPMFLDGELQAVTEQKSKFAEAIRSIPAKAEPKIIEADTPFTAYLYLKSICENNSLKSLVWVDAWMGEEVFHRYLRWVEDSVKITLITKEPTSKRDKPRWSRFLDLSRLFAAERGLDSYELRVSDSMHDRLLVVDDNRIFHLGGSSKDAAKKHFYTVSYLEPTEVNLNTVAKIRNNAQEWFGSAATAHP